MESLSRFFNRAKPFLAVISMQFGYAGMVILCKLALDHGMSHYALVVYRHAIATIVIAPFAFIFDRNTRPRITRSIFIKMLLLGLLEPTIDQNLYFTGMKYTSATFASAMNNILPAFAFLMAWILRLEKVNLRKVHSQAKIMGTIVTVGGAMLMTLVKGTVLELPWTKGHDQQHSTSALTKQNPIKGALMITIGCVCWAGFVNLQAITLKSYPAQLSLTFFICLMATIEGTIVAFAMERSNLSIWSIGWNYTLLASVYTGIVCSGFAYCVQGLVMKSRGPVFVTAFSPLCMVIVTIIGSLFMSETLYLGRILGAMVIVIGLYLVLWGKSKDQPPLKIGTNDDKVAANPKMDASNELDTTNQEFVAIDLTKVRPNSNVSD